MEIIVDGTGKGYTVKVDDSNRLHVDSVSTNREESQSQRGYSFNINTGNLTLTNGATANGVLYIKNNEKFDLICSNFFYNFGNSTGGSGNMYVDVIRNPTAGTLISGALEVDVNVNRNFGSSRVLDVTAYKGATGTTITDGTTTIKSIFNTSAQRVALSAGAITIPKGSAIGIVFTTPTANTSLVCNFSVACYLEDEENQFS